MRVCKPLCLTLISAGLAVGACSKAEETPKPPIVRVNPREPAEEPAKPSTPPTPAKPDPKAAREGDQGSLGNRTDALKEMLVLMERGDFAMAFKRLTDSAKWSEVGLPGGDLSSLDKLIAFQRASRTGFSDFTLKPRRIIESDDYQVVEYVWSARHTGAFPDGTPATNRPAVLPGAMLIHYQKEGLIDRDWVFQDWPNVAQQLGLAPGLPADFRPVTMPGTLEIIVGANEPRYEGRFREFLGGLTPEAYQTMMRDLTTERFSLSDVRWGRYLSGREASSTYLGERIKSFKILKSDIEAAIGAGTHFAAFTTNELEYLGGFMNVPAEGQKVTTHTLDIIQFTPDTLRFETLASYGNSYETIAALQRTAGGAARPRSTPRFGITPCDAYVTKLRECTESLEGQAKDLATDAFEKQVETWLEEPSGDARTEKLSTSCKTALALAKTTYADACPRVDWD